MSWNYRLVHRFDGVLQEDVYAIHEAYYDEGADRPHSITKNPVYPQSDTFEGFTKVMAAYDKAYLQPRNRILEYTDFVLTGEGEG